MSDTTALVAFLADRLGEDETVAKAAARSCENGFAGRAHWVSAYGTVVAADDPENYAIMTDTTQEVHEHIARHDPARVLREVEAKRAILALHQIETTYVESRDDDGHPIKIPEVQCYVCGWASDIEGSGCETLRALASVFLDHSDYDPAWAPEGART